MGHFFFDVFDGDEVQPDAFGVDLEGIEEAADQAAALLPDIARDALPGNDSREFAIEVRDDRGRVVCRSTLSFRCRRFASGDGPGPGADEVVVRFPAEAAGRRLRGPRGA